jgi:apolipoprotein N-acyltransferase
MGVSGLLTAVVLVSFSYPINNLPWVVIAVAIAAIVWSARMIVSDHTNKELVVGFAIGLGTQLAAFLWVS